MTPPARIGVIALGVLAAAAFLPPRVPAAPESPAPRSARIEPGAPLRPAAGVRDAGLALLVGIFDDERRGLFTRERVIREIDRGGRPTRVPLDAFGSLARSVPEGRAHAADVALFFRGNGEMPVPYDILGYRPGKLRASREVRLLEWSLGELRFTPARPVEGGAPVLELRDLRVWGVAGGTVDLDIDGWLDRLLGAGLDDTRMVGFALFRLRGRRVAMAMGYNREGRGHSGAFLLDEDRIVYPYPDEYKAIGRLLRSRVEFLMERSGAPRAPVRRR